MSHALAKKEARRLVKLVTRMYAPRGTNTRESMVITRFILLTQELENALQARANGQRDTVVLSIIALLQQHAV